MSLVAINLDRATAGHLAVAIELYRRSLDRNGTQPPSALVDLQHLAIEVARSGEGDAPGRTGACEDAAPRSDPSRSYAGRDDRQLLTQKDAAEVLGVHPRTVRRWLDTGDLGSVTVGSRRRIPRQETDRFLDTQAQANGADAR